MWQEYLDLVASFENKNKRKELEKKFGLPSMAALENKDPVKKGDHWNWVPLDEMYYTMFESVFVYVYRGGATVPWNTPAQESVQLQLCKQTLSLNIIES